MKKFERILVPIDVSEHSRKILRYAFTFAVAMDLDLVVLHVVDSRTLQPMPYSHGQVDADHHSKISESEMVEEIKAVVQEQIDAGITFDHQLNVKTSVKFGVPYDQIIKTATREAVDFIVMGATGHTALEDFFMGGVAEKVSRRAKCPVFLVRPREKNQ